MKIGFVGLGQMGKPMAMNMLRSDGIDLAVYSADQSCYGEFIRAGVRTAESLSHLSDSQAIFLCLPNGDVVKDVLFGVNGLADKLSKGTVVVDHSTIEHGSTMEIGAALEARGIRFLDAPVSGMESRAVDGTLTVMCGGEFSTFEWAEPFLRCVGNNILFMGPRGSGQLTKLVNQLLFDINCAALAEVLPMAVKMGLDADKIASVVNSGTGRSYASEFFVPRVLQRQFSTGYPLTHAYKDLVSAAELGARQCIPMPVLAASTATYQQALLAGHGALDKGAMILPFERALGVEFRSEVK
ncbi:NAD(P)-dependent oxidoreductase [Pandoraea cepalis]|uniref:2-hydroxy-3-oxopropionate reductase n=1 Tax=Pandoraea cepalis TaxID=2508294 RepID=A0A5E4VNK8_9BURK|nr:NAD(P)-dependent oxidoreductase [Pandoraea cepalis]VVE13493.1 2-hydroxy-3-oxopropionate reductase [Pandoraea cepalis]